MGMAVATLLVLCMISLTSCSLSTRPAAPALHPRVLRRGLERALRGRRLAEAKAAGDAVVPIHWSLPFYVTDFTIGTPPQPVTGIIDLAGKLVWTQCAPCRGRRCFKQELPLFDPAKSSTYHVEPCGTDRCKSVAGNCSSDTVCSYNGHAGPGGHTVGIGGTDVIAIGTAKASLGFGCVVDSDFDNFSGPSGFVGLGRTPWSLVAQMNVTAFSYCLAPPDSGKKSELFLGASAKLAGGKSSSTKLVKTSPDDILSQYYVVRLEGIQAGKAAVATPPNGSIVLIDTASPASYLVDGDYQAVKKAVMAKVGAPTAKPLEPYDLCFPEAAVSSAPDLVFTFQGAAPLTVPPSNYLPYAGKKTVCLAIFSSARLNVTGAEELSILGSFQQENIRFFFDLKEETLSFEPADCSSAAPYPNGRFFFLEVVLVLPLLFMLV